MEGTTEQSAASTAIAVIITPEDEVAAETRIAEASAYFVRPRNSLRELAFEAAFIDMVLTETQGELTPALEKRMDANTFALLQKADGVRDYIAALKTDAAVVKEEVDRLQDIHAALVAREKRFKAYVLACMKAMGTKRLEGAYGGVREHGNPPSVEILLPELLPKKFTYDVTTVHTNTDMLKDELKICEGETLLVPNGEVRPQIVPDTVPTQYVTDDDGNPVLLPVLVPVARLVRGSHLRTF